MVWDMRYDYMRVSKTRENFVWKRAISLLTSRPIVNKYRRSPYNTLQVKVHVKSTCRLIGNKSRTLWMANQQIVSTCVTHNGSVHVQSLCEILWKKKCGESILQYLTYKKDWKKKYFLHCNYSLNIDMPVPYYRCVRQPFLHINEYFHVFIEQT